MVHQPFLTKLATLAAALSILGIAGCINQEQPAPPQPIPTQATQATATTVSTPTSDATPVRTPTASTAGTATTGSPTATPIRTPTSGTPGPTPLPAGSLLTMNNLQQTWTTKGLTVTTGSQSTGFTGFSIQPADVRLAKGSDILAASVLVYLSRDALMNDWDTTKPAAVAPKGVRALPTHVSVWWSENVIVVVRERSSSAIGSDALDAFFALTP